MSRTPPPRVSVGAHGLPDRAPGLDVEPGRRLVEDDEPRVASEGKRDGDTPALAAGEAPELAADETRELKAVVDQARVERPGVVGPDQLEQLAHAKRRRKRGLLRCHAERTAGGRQPRVGPEEPHRPAVGPAETGEHRDGRRLSSTVRPEQRHHFACAYRERCRVESPGRTEALGHSFELGEDHGGAPRS